MQRGAAWSRAEGLERLGGLGEAFRAWGLDVSHEGEAGEKGDIQVSCTAI